MKANWTTPIAIAAVVLTLINMVLTMNRVSETSAVEIEARIVALERDGARAQLWRDAMERKLSGRFDFMNDASSRIEYLCNNDPNCRARFGAMRVPE